MSSWLGAWLWFAVRDHPVLGIATALWFVEKRLPFYWRICSVLIAVAWSMHVATMLDVGKVHDCDARPSHQDYKAEDCAMWSTPWALRGASILGQWLMGDATMMLARLLERKRLQDSKNCFIRVWLRVGFMLTPLVLAALGAWLTVRVHTVGYAYDQEAEKETQYMKQHPEYNWLHNQKATTIPVPGVAYIHPSIPFSWQELVLSTALSWCTQFGSSLLVCGLWHSWKAHPKMRSVDSVQVYFGQHGDICPCGCCEGKDSAHQQALPCVQQHQAPPVPQPQIWAPYPPQPMKLYTAYAPQSFNPKDQRMHGVAMEQYYPHI